MNDMNREGYTFKLTESGHIDIDYYMNRAHLSRAQAATKMVCYARDKLIMLVRNTVCLFTSKPYKQPRNNRSD